MTNSIVSAIIPIYNGEKHIERAIRSVTSQTYTPIELILIDDGSTDGTSKIVRSFKDVIYKFQQNSGAAAARNFAAQFAHGEFLAFLDSDDEWLPTKTQIQVEYLQSHPDLGYCVTMQRLILDPGVEPPVWMADLVQDHVGYFSSTLIVRKEVFKKVGGFNISLRYADNADWFLRASEAKVSAGIIRQTLLYKHIHAANLTHHRDQIRSEVLKSFRNSVARRHAKEAKE